MDREMRQVLAELELTSCGTTASVDSSHGAFGSREPRSGDADPPFVLFRDAWLAEDSERGRERVLHEARRELKELRRRQAPLAPAVEETREDRNARIYKKVDMGWGFDEIASHFRCSKGEIKTALKERDTLRGGGLDAQERREKVAVMKHGGMSIRNIALALRVSSKTVERDLAA